MKKLKEKTGITLIALVITIIVLLILAGVTVITLTGDNGLLTKASDAKQANEEAAALEKIKTEVAGSYNLEGKIDLNELKTNLKRLNISDEDITPTIKDEKETFPLTIKIKENVYDIYNNGNIIGPIDYKKLESLYGKLVNGYSGYTATDVTEWKLLYVDEQYNEAFIVSSNAIPLGPPIPLTSVKGIEYTGSNNVANSEYGRKYNRLWLEKCTEESTEINAKAVAYLCDSDNWSQYVTEKAKYAAGGPTLEIYAAVGKGMQVREIMINGVNSVGYLTNGGTGIVNETFRKDLLNLGGAYWYASPSTYKNYIHFGSDGEYYHYSYGR